MISNKNGYSTRICEIQDFTLSKCLHRIGMGSNTICGTFVRIGLDGISADLKNVVE